MKSHSEKNGFSVVAVRSEEKPGRLFVGNRKAFESDYKRSEIICPKGVLKL